MKNYSPSNFSYLELCDLLILKKCQGDCENLKTQVIVREISELFVKFAVFFRGLRQFLHFWQH